MASKKIQDNKDQERLQLVVPIRTKNLIQELQVRIESGSLAETIRRAIVLLDAVSKFQEDDGKIIVRWKDGKETELLIL